MIFSKNVLYCASMSFVETIEKIVHNTSQSSERIPLVPSPKLQDIIDKSKILGLFNQLRDLPVKTEEEVINDGKKMVVVAKWGDEVRNNSQIIVSITESSISFIGNYVDNQYIRLEGKNMYDSKKIKESLKNTFLNPQIART